ncbi:DUF4358 domain-containing protein [Clostridium gasigenes]|uniref:DUF4358 domain-containing protein n=1 Tax=Clostridium gasigenes TaxID=94869 RepID=A0A1H0NNR9_9CLOT|nr:DUF4358 domain-containing protein [Clostridium gasigenes]MBB6623629.1 DUF4358 domain-containing protein [Clostridium gasigenes]MBU3087570.1 DUF4358 domain-containing protein [Clostridium gasigenes]MBU3105373.1 DUF4358 domain-containing protein [Clostridium gasigenes]MBU3131773.1 DUF4358 domain-containing protein [Clostridium gasigenes]MBU3135245.1 DUF4358 domain-containing protein [Clostridium gasigenes]
MKKSTYKKYYLIQIIIIVVIFIGLYPIVKVRQANMDDIRNSIEKSVSLDRMDMGNEKILKKLYYINIKDLEDFIYYAPKSNMDEDEILVLKVKDEKNIPIIKSQIQKRIDKKAESFKNYRPEKYEIIKNAVLEDEGQYLIFIISQDSYNIKEAIKKDFK